MNFIMMMKMMGASTNRFINDDSMQLGVNRETTMLLQLIYYMNIIFLLYLCIRHRYRGIGIGIGIAASA
jgi:hypothetical protein